jgi:hypothetical protein
VIAHVSGLPAAPTLRITATTCTRSETLAPVMESAAALHAPALPQLIRFGLIGLLLTLGLVAWAVTDERMGGMDAGPGTALGAAGWFVGVWAVMMAAMMFPSIAPMVVMYARIQEGKREEGKGRRRGPRPSSWPATSSPGPLPVSPSLRFSRPGARFHRRPLVGPRRPICGRWRDRRRREPPAHSGQGRVSAALSEPVHVPDRSLEAGSPRGTSHGIERGGWCVGCCWALMAALFALGVMSIGWMAFIAALIAIEKLLRLVV